MRIDDIIKVTQDFLEKQTMLSDEQTRGLQEGLGIMFADIDLMMNDKQIIKSQDKLAKVMNSIIMISSVVLEAPLQDDFCKFVATFAELTFNWNANTYEDELFRQLSLYMSRTIDTRNTMLRGIATAKDIDDRMHLLGGWTPPAYEVSKAYFEQLLEENEM